MNVMKRQIRLTYDYYMMYSSVLLSVAPFAFHLQFCLLLICHCIMFSLHLQTRANDYVAS